MSTAQYNWDDSAVATEALAKFRVVVAGGAKQTVKYPGAADANAIQGVTQEATTASGDTVLIRRQGVSKVTIATSVSYGVPLRVHDLQGRVSGQVGAWLTGDGVVGYALEAGSTSGDIIECWLGIRTLLG